MLLCGLEDFEDKDRTREVFVSRVDDIILKVQPPEVVLVVLEALYVPTTPKVHSASLSLSATESLYLLGQDSPRTLLFFRQTSTTHEFSRLKIAVTTGFVIGSFLALCSRP